MNSTFPVSSFKHLETPFYYYDMDLLRQTLSHIKSEILKYENYHIHYAVKANANPKLLTTISHMGLGADCVSGGEIRRALDTGFPASGIVFAGVGKADWEIKLALERDIFCFNAESVPELEIINKLAAGKNKIASVALRINPDVGAQTHASITTGLAENKFGIPAKDIENVIKAIQNMPYLQLIGLHFHIGSQILQLNDFAALCNKINEIQENLSKQYIPLPHINVGGGLGIDYQHPDLCPIASFAEYFAIFRKNLKLFPGQQVHFELGRSIIGQCGSLISKVLYIKQGINKKFIILDAGMTDLIRPALYHAYHQIDNISSENPFEKYDIVGPVCESSDVFGKAISLNGTQRGDLLAIRSAGAYGEVMVSTYNCRPLPSNYTSDELKQTFT